MEGRMRGRMERRMKDEEGREEKRGKNEGGRRDRKIKDGEERAIERYHQRNKYTSLHLVQP